MTKFAIVIEVCEQLTEDELWPDGDAPDNPTVSDVRKLIDENGGPEAIIGDWNLPLRFNVYEIKCGRWENR